jgi:sialate O-acetylesterase
MVDEVVVGKAELKSVPAKTGYRKQAYKYRSNWVKKVAVLCGLFLSAFGSTSAFAALTVSPIFRSDMVLQQGMAVPVFGSADPGATVTVQFRNQSGSAVADSDGRWQVNLASMSASAFPSAMTVTSGSASVSFTGVQVGEVWVYSGQSNMGLPLSNANGGSAAIADSPNHNIRLFRMTGGAGPGSSSWQVASATTTPGFSAVAWWMGLELSQTLNVPVGLIQATHDGTSISEWTHSNGGTGDDYDAMVKAIQPFAVRGIAWYQGESDGGDNTYDIKLTGMISEWRGDWDLPGLPFGIVQLTWRPSGYVPCREAQLRVATSMPNTFLVVTTDIPVSNALHPREKKPVGIRLGIGARGAVYGENIEYSGPIRDDSASFVSGNTVVINFTHLGNGLFTGGSLPPGPFKIAGSNGRFQTANAMIVGNSVHVWSSSVSAPKTVRYQWDYGVGNLYNLVSIPTEGGAVLVDRLPASQFELKFP